MRAFVGIGGHLDEGESWGQAVEREALEEACCPISLGDSAVTYWCRQETTPRPIAYRWNEPNRPLLVWTGHFPAASRAGAPSHPRDYRRRGLRAAALAEPIPCTEIPALLLMDHETLLHTYAAPRPLDELLARVRADHRRMPCA